MFGFLGLVLAGLGLLWAFEYFFCFTGFLGFFFHSVYWWGGVGDFRDLSALGRVFFGLLDDFLLFYGFLLA